MLTITDCKVFRNNVIVITDPESAALYDDLQPTMHVIVKGFAAAPPLVNNAIYKITGTVSGLSRTFLNMKCVNTGDPARFDKS